MNSVYIAGGLGNQLFQYVFSEYLKKLGVRDVRIDRTWFEGNCVGGTSREFLLDRFNTDYICTDGCVQNEYQCTENEYVDEIPLNVDDVSYVGYWQDIRFFSYVRAEVSSRLILRSEYIDDDMRACMDGMRACNSVALHIRRTDYLNAENVQVFEQLTQDYYGQAVSLIGELTGEAPVLYIFSDDTEYVRANMDGFMGCRTVIMEQREPYQDMYLMSGTRHNVIANSTFSWWGATLNYYADNITVAPSAWLRGRKLNLYHDDWIVL